MKVLILGKGFVGAKLAAYLLKNNIDIFNISQTEINYTNERTLSTLLRDYNFTHVINCCGFTGVPNVDGCELNKEACWDLNVVVASRIDRVVNHYNKKCLHISSGCIYNGYEKEFEETDTPNFGLFNPESSFYSKTKHAFETLIDTKRSAIFRIRMPFTGERENKNYLYKLLKYDNLISLPNSLTCIDDLNDLVFKFLNAFKPGIFNVVNPQSMSAEEITDVMKRFNLINPNWKFVDIKELNIIAGRSNCVLSADKLKNLGLSLPDTCVSLERCIKSL